MIRQLMKSNEKKEKETVLRQLPIYNMNYTLAVMLSYHTDFVGPIVCSAPYLFLGFIPKIFDAKSRHNTTQGYEANGNNVTFEQCGDNLSSHIVICTSLGQDASNKECDVSHIGIKFADYSVVAGTEMDPHFYFEYFEIAFGGCGTFLTHACPKKTRDVMKLSFGLPFQIH